MILNNNLKISSKKAILNEEKPSFDIANPSFTINNNGKKISVKAKKGKFLSKDLILLEDNVTFKSTRFKLLTDKVTFNQKDQTAESKLSSKFESNNTKIISEGFKITNSGNKILFDGKTILILN